jgi:carbonic anhydrase
MKSPMSGVLDEILRANSIYAESFGDKSELPIPPKLQCAILTCMDARLIPSLFAGLVEGDAHVIRNAGGRASDDAIRSLIISHKLLGTKEFFVIHHTDCGMSKFTEDEMRERLTQSLEIATVDAKAGRDSGTGSSEAEFINWLTFKDSEKSVVSDVRRIREHPLIPKNIPVYGYLFDVKTGRLIEVEEATKIGSAS